MNSLHYIVRERRNVSEIGNDLRKYALDLGCEHLKIGLVPYFASGDRIAYGDSFLCLVEVSGPNGQFGELGRCVSLGETSAPLKRAYQVALQSKKLLEEEIKPGIFPGELVLIHNAFMEANGYLPEKRLLGHGQSCDIVERPIFMTAETMCLEENMFVAIHPEVNDGRPLGISCDNYLVTATGCERLNLISEDILICG